MTAMCSLPAALLAVRGGARRGRTILIVGPCNAGKTALWLQVRKSCV